MKRSSIHFEPASGLRPDRIVARVPFALKDVAKSVRYGAFDYDAKSWWWPVTHATAQQVYDALYLSRPELDDWCAERVRTNAWCGLTPPSYDHIEPIDMPHARTEPWRHQRLGYSLIMKNTATLLWWDMGVGKTHPALNAAATLGGLVLVVAPKIVCPVWCHQLPVHTTLDESEYRAVDLSQYSGKAAAAIARDAIRYAGDTRLTLLAVNHAKACSGPLAEVLASVPAWSMAIMDESHYIKNGSAKITKYVSRKIGPRAKKRLALTGTFVPKNLLDAHGQFAFLDTRIFGESPVPFRSRYGVYGGFEGRELVGYRNLDDFNEKVFRITHCVGKRDVHDLPPVTKRIIPVELSPEARRVYNRLHATLVADVTEGRLTASNAATRAVHLQKITSGFLDVEAATEAGLEPRTARIDTGKRDRLREWMDDIGADEPLVVFAHFRRDLETIAEVAAAAGRGYSEISGARHDVSSVWLPSPGRVLGVQIQAGGVGIDLTASAYACYYSVGHNGGAHQQSLARLDRPGQTRSVEYSFLVATNTVDESVHEALDAKADVADALFSWAKGAPSPAPEACVR